ncbi:MAG: hypothetical protein IJS02_00665 [Bacteroidales bacterium]|nr:hypothetical protein [Bacteroidales bacterium]
MKVTKKKKDDFNLKVSITVDKEDYAEEKKKKLNNYRKNAELKGFRKGMAPMSLIEKMYGGKALGEVINDLVSEQLNLFVEKNKLNILGEPLPSEEESKNDWENGESFKFDFDLGLAPEVKVEVAKEDVIPYYTITATAKAVADYRESMLKQVGTLKEGEDGKKELVAAEANQETFDKLFGKGNVKNEEEFVAKIKDNLKREYEMESDYRFGIDAKNYLIDKAAISLPDDFLKRWLTYANEGKFTREDVEKEYEGFAKDFRWQLIRTQLLKDNNIKIEKDDMVQEAKNVAAYQFAMYGMNNVPDEDLNGFASKMLEDGEQARRIFEKLENDKVLDFVKKTATLEKKKTTPDKLRNMAN